jgi:hypothetical protein
MLCILFIFKNSIINCQGLRSAMAARLIPNQKVACSSHVVVKYFFKLRNLVSYIFLILDDYEDFNDSNYYNDDDKNADEDAYNYELHPHTSYESYKKKILQEFNEDDF